MSDIIHLLPDSIANQIAAGEVIQRPASVVKELMENSIDAGAEELIVNIKDAGRTLIQVIDNGKGMSETDARLAFERHATSKIKQADDLFALRTMGFRGEALASIAAVAHVELKTKQKEAQTGTKINITASRFESQEDIAMADGSIFSVKNLFFNVPARRKFLKSNETEFRNILVEFERVALVNPQVSFQLFHNDVEVFNLPTAPIRQRIANILGKGLNQQLLPIHIETSLIKLSGFIGTPSSARKRGALQYFFVNGRYMRHPYFHKAVMLAFEPFIPAGESPNYFIFFDIDPTCIDVNIHPTKTEIKFEHEQAIFPIIVAAVKESIGKSAVVPSIEFDQEGAIDIPVYHEGKTVSEAPRIDYKADYNPFKQTATACKPNRDWELLFEKNEHRKPDQYAFPEPEEEDTDSLYLKEDTTEEGTARKGEDPVTMFDDLLSNHFLYKGKYIITTLKSGLALIDQRRAHIRILFDRYARQLNDKKGSSQGMLFPEIIAFTPQEATILPYLLEELAYIGYDLADLGGNSYSINGIPAGTEKLDPVDALKNMVSKVLETGCEIREDICDALALSLARQAAINYGKNLSGEEANNLIAQLFSSSSPNYTPDGKLIISLLNDDELEKRFK